MMEIQLRKGIVVVNRMRRQAQAGRRTSSDMAQPPNCPTAKNPHPTPSFLPFQQPEFISKPAIGFHHDFPEF